MDLFDNNNSNENEDIDLESGLDNSLFDTMSDDDLNNALEGIGDESNEADTTGKKSTVKTAIIAIIIGVVIVIVGLCIAGAVGGKQGQQGQEQVQEKVTSNAENKNEAASKSVDSSWVKISNSEKVTFNKDYKDLTFTVTGIEHYAKKVDSKGNLMIKTELTGSLSGLSGIYNLEVPYNKGARLIVGDEFTVKVLIGSYGEKSVVGSILWK